MAEHFDNPPALQGDSQAQLAGMYRYLCRVSEQLNQVMNSLTIENFSTEDRKRLQVAAASAGVSEPSYVNTLKSMIIKSAEIVTTRAEEIRTSLEQQVTAISNDFGTYKQTLGSTIEATAKGIVQNYRYDEQIKSVADSGNDFMKHIEAYIFSGIVRYDSENNPVYGIAIGDGPQGGSEGITHYDGGNKSMNAGIAMATFTKDRLSFYTGQAEVAYFSNRKLFIEDCQVKNTMQMGNFVWKIQSDNSMGLVVNTPESSGGGEE